MIGVMARLGLDVAPVPALPHRLVPDGDVAAELARLHDACDRARERLRYVRDRAERRRLVAEALAVAGIDLLSEELAPAQPGKGRVMAVLGKAGSGKTLLLSELTRALVGAGVQVVSGDYESKRKKDARTVAILAPTNKAAFVLRTRGVPATTIHRILYTPVYDPEYERLAEWLTGTGDRPRIEGLTDEEARETALGIWSRINEPNLRDNVEPSRSRATLILTKSANHEVSRIRMRKV